VAARAGAATGTVYRHFPSKAELFAEVFRRAAQREVDATRAAGEAAGPRAADRLAAAIEVFARRALRGRRLAWALLAEPVDPAVEVERLTFRRAYAAVFAEMLRDGVAREELAPQNVELSAAALVGALGEALVGPLSPVARDVDADRLVADLVTFCLRSVTEETT
jgi:AcrR family transcriptional regulator